MEKNKLVIIPKYAILPLILVVVWNMTVYFGNRFLTENFYHYNFTTSFDRMIPVIPFMVTIYLGSYLFWIINYIIGARQSKLHAYRLCFADLLAKTICLFFYIFLPTTLIRPEINGNDFFSFLLKNLYLSDAADNLLPSIHCLVSWLSFIAVRGQKKVYHWYQIFSLIMALAICISTLTTKQHVLIDAFSGIFLAEISYYLMTKLIKK